MKSKKSFKTNNISDDLYLVGEHGDIWLVSSETCGAVIHSAEVIHKYVPEMKNTFERGDEVLISFPLGNLAEWVERLNITENRSGMLRLTSWFDE